MTDARNLAFSLRHITRELSCEEAGHNLTNGAECRFLHTTLTGDATLTISGPAELVRRAGAAALPFFAAVLDGPSTPIAPAQTAPDTKCPSCGWVGFHSAECATWKEPATASEQESAFQSPAPIHPSHDPIPLDRGASRCARCRQVLSWRSSGTSVRGALECPGHPVQDPPSEQESAFLSAAELDEMYTGATVTALGMSAEERSSGERCRWTKAPNGYWFPDGGGHGTSSGALAKHHKPMLDKPSDDA